MNPTATTTLLTAKDRHALPPLYAQQRVREPIAYVKLFCPFGRYMFFVTEYDGDDRLFGYCVSQFGQDCDEWAYASLSELEGATVSAARLFGLPVEPDHEGVRIPAIERNRHFDSATVCDCLASLQRDGLDVRPERGKPNGG